MDMWSKGLVVAAIMACGCGAELREPETDRPSGASKAAEATSRARELGVQERLTRVPRAQLLAAPTIARVGDLSWARALDLPCTEDRCDGVVDTTLTGPELAAVVRPDLGIIKPRLGNSVVLLSTGIAGAGLDGLEPTPEPGKDFDLPGVDGDAVTLQLILRVPANANRLSFQYNFLSTESPEFVQTIFNDTFSVQFTDSSGQRDFTLSSVNDSRFFEASDSHAKGTGFDLYADEPAGLDSLFGGLFPDAGLTDFQVFSVDVVPNSQVQLTFAIQDNGDGVADSAVVLDALQFSAIEAVDPAPDLVVAGAVIRDPELLAVGGRAVRGAVADGAAQVLLRVKVDGPGTVTFALPPAPGTTTPINGTLSAVDGKLPTNPADPTSSISIDVVAAAGGSYAFAVYHAPADFNRVGEDDAKLLERPLAVTAAYVAAPEAGASFNAQVELRLRRPPVVLARGLWSNPFFWLPPDGTPRDPAFLTNNPAFDVSFAPQPYSCTLELRLDLEFGTQITTCPWTRKAEPEGLVVCKNELATTISAATAQALVNVRKLGIAAMKVDVVAHGDMGVQARRYIDSDVYADDINRLVTVNTPHFGTRAVDAIVVTRGTEPEVAPKTEDVLCRARANAKVQLDDGDLDSLKTQVIALKQTRVPSHAIVGTKGGALTSPAFKIRTGALLGTYSDVKRKIAVNIGKASANGCFVFGTDDHDLFVETVSQRGGLEGMAVTEFPMSQVPDANVTPDQLTDYLHSTRNVNVSTKLVDLLNSPIAGPTFAQFPDATTLTPNCGLTPLAGPSRTHSLAAPTGTVRIVSPASGTEVLAGSFVTVEIAAEDGLVPASVLAAIGDSVGSSVTAPFTTQVRVPPAGLGPVSLVVIATDRDEELVVSEAVTLNVRTNAVLRAIRITPQDPVLFGLGRQRSLDVLGDYSDDILRDIGSGAFGTTYHSSNPAIVTVSAAGLVTGVGPGIATVSVRNGTVQESISVTVIGNRAPVALARSEAIASCIASGQTSSVQLDGLASFDPDGDPLTFAWFEAGVVVATGATPVVELGPGVHVISLVVSDGTTKSSAATIEVALLGDSEPPVIQCPTVSDLECVAHGAVASFAAAASDNCALSTQSCVPISGSILPLGVTSVTCSASDVAGNAASCGIAVRVRDTAKPDVTTRPQRRVLWPPDHRYRTFRLSDCVTDVHDTCEGELDIDAVGRITRITSDEAEHDRHHHGHHDEDQCDDIVITGSSTAKLRAERDAHGNGRVYTVFFNVTDPSGNIRARSCQVAVPRWFPFGPVQDDNCHFCVGAECGSCPGPDPKCR